MKSASNYLRASALGLATVALLIFAGCGDNKSSDAQTTAATGEFAGVKTYLLDHTKPLERTTATLQGHAEHYYELAKAANFDYAELLKISRAEVAKTVAAMQAAWRQANPLYEQAEGVVAGVPELADFDVILDAGGSAKDDPASAVPFNLKLPNGKVEKQPGNFFFLTETALWGTEAAFAAPNVEPDLNDDGKVAFGEALPEANHLVAATRDFHKNVVDLETAAKAWQPQRSDVFTALVVMTPTMAEYFEAWKNSRFVAGTKATEASFVGASRLGDITDILAGLVLVYDNVKPLIADVSASQAEQTGSQLTKLHDFAADVRDREAGGEKFTAEQAESLGSEAQANAEQIAGQVTQAAAKLNVEIVN